MSSHIRIGSANMINKLGKQNSTVIMTFSEKFRKQRPKHCKLPPSHSATLQLGKVLVTTHLPLPISIAAYHAEMEEYIIRKARFASRSFCKMVDWESRYRASLKLWGSQKNTVFKLEFDLLATLQRRNKYYKNMDKRCFRCKRSNIDINHVIWCPPANSSRIKS